MKGTCASPWSLCPDVWRVCSFRMPPQQSMELSAPVTDTGRTAQLAAPSDVIGTRLQTENRGEYPRNVDVRTRCALLHRAANGGPSRGFENHRVGDAAAEKSRSVLRISSDNWGMVCRSSALSDDVLAIRRGSATGMPPDMNDARTFTGAGPPPSGVGRGNSRHSAKNSADPRNPGAQSSRRASGSREPHRIALVASKQLGRRPYCRWIGADAQKEGHATRDATPTIALRTRSDVRRRAAAARKGPRRMRNPPHLADTDNCPGVRTEMVVVLHNHRSSFRINA